ncbi:MAG: hypothetical protein WC819_01495 [Parcubacteria group bacterium]
MRIMKVAHTIFDIALEAKILEVPDRLALVLALQHEEMPVPCLVSKIGYSFPDDVFFTGCFGLAPEKIGRTFANGHLSSFQTRDDENKKYGGGIVLNIHGVRWGIAASGLRALEDEGVALVSGMYTFNISSFTSEIHKILEISGNTFAEKLLKKVSDEIGPPARFLKHVFVRA